MSRYLSNNESGATLVELLVNIAILGVLLAGVSSEYFLSTRRAFDRKTVASTQDEARTLLDLMAYDLRMAGAGMPLGQTNFRYTQPEVGEAALPIAITASNDYIDLLFNERGKNTVLDADYTPSLSNLTFTVLSGEDFSEGDIIYLSNMSTGGVDGLRGEIDAWLEMQSQLDLITKLQGVSHLVPVALCTKLLLLLMSLTY